FIGGKWKAVFLIYLVAGSKRENELRQLMRTSTERTFVLQLKHLESDGRTSRKEYTPKPPVMKNYPLTEFGKSLAPVLREIASWGGRANELSPKIAVRKPAQH